MLNANDSLNEQPVTEPITFLFSLFTLYRPQKTKKRPAGATALYPMSGVLVAVQSASLRRYDPDQVPRVVSLAAKLSVIFYSPSGGTDVFKACRTGKPML